MSIEIYGKFLLGRLLLLRELSARYECEVSADSVAAECEAESAETLHTPELTSIRWGSKRGHQNFFPQEGYQSSCISAPIAAQAKGGRQNFFTLAKQGG